VHWHASGVSAYWVNGQAGAGDDGSLQTCPCQDETHTLRATLPDGSEQNASVTIRVSGECVTPETPLGVPSPNTPRNGAELDCRTSQTLVWVPVEAPGGSVRYYVKLEQQIGGNWQSVRGWGPESGKQVEAPVECGGVYRWAVRAEDGSGNVSDWSSWSRFSVAEEEAPPPPEEPSPPPVPSPNTPANGAELGCVAQVSLIWVPVEAPGGSIQYLVKLEREVQGKWQTVAGFGPTNDKRVTANVDCGLRYRWTVRAEDGPGNYSDWAPWQVFTVTLN
jgi:hypothetical protein